MRYQISREGLRITTSYASKEEAAERQGVSIEDVEVHLQVGKASKDYLLHLYDDDAIAYVGLDFELQLLWVSTVRALNFKEGTLVTRDKNGLRWWKINKLDSESLNARLLNRVKPLAQKLLENPDDDNLVQEISDILH